MKDLYVATDGKGDRVETAEEKDGERRQPLWRSEEDYSEVIKNEPVTANPLAAFMVRPPYIRFETQDREEKILLLLRKHLVTNLKWIMIAGLGLLVPMAFVFFPFFNGLPEGFQVVTVLIWYLMVFGFAFENFLAWYFNVYIVTDERIIDYDFYSLLYKRVSEAKIDKIEDVTFVMGGAIQSMFGYGNVYIQTAGEQRELDFESVPRPDVVVKLINELVLEEEREKLEGRVR